MTSVELPDWAEVLWDETARHIALWGGRGGAKSRSIASALVIQAAQGHQRILCGREVQKSIKDSVKRLIEDEIDRCGLSHLFVVTDNEIRGPHESLFLFAGIRGNATGIKSIEGITRFWGEEAATFSAASIDTVVPTIRAPGSQLWWSWNPDQPTDPIDQMFRGLAPNPDRPWPGPPPRSVIRNVNWDANPWFPPDLREQMEFDRARDPDKYHHVWQGGYRANSEARVFRNWSIDAVLEPPVGVEFRLGADFGFSIDPSCALRCWIDGNRICVDHEAWGLGVEIVNLPNLFMSIPDAEKWWMTADSSRPETISHLRNNGFPRIRPATKGARSVEEGVEWLKSYDIVVHPRCVHLIEELTLYSYKTDKLTGDVLPVLEDKDNHMIDALRYACEGARRALTAKPKVRTVHIPPTRTAWSR